MFVNPTCEENMKRLLVVVVMMCGMLFANIGCKADGSVDDGAVIGAGIKIIQLIFESTQGAGNKRAPDNQVINFKPESVSNDARSFAFMSGSQIIVSGKLDGNKGTITTYNLQAGQEVRVKLVFSKVASDQNFSAGDQLQDPSGAIYLLIDNSKLQ